MKHKPHKNDASFGSSNVSVWRWNQQMSEFCSPCNWYSTAIGSSAFEGRGLPISQFNLSLIIFYAFVKGQPKVGMGDILHAICMRISSVKQVPWLALNLHHLFSNGAVFNTQSRSSQTSYAYIDWYITFDMNTILRSLSVNYGSVY